MARLAPSRPAACDCEVHQLMHLPQAACRRACARHLARSESAADCPPGRLFSAVRRQGPGAGCNSCTLPIRVVGEDGKSYPERRRISARSAFPESNPDGSGPEPASKPDVNPVPDPAVSAAADPEVRASVASRCRAQRSTARPSPTRSSRPCGSQQSQRAQDRSNRIVSVVAFDARNFLCPRRIGLTSAPSTDRSMLSGWIADLERRAGAARSRATDQAVARGGGQWRSRSGAARSRSVRAGLTRCACRRPVWRNGRSAVVMAQRSPPSPIPPSSAIPTPPTEPTGIVVLALVHEITRTTSMFRHDTDGRRRVFTSATYAVSSVLRGFVVHRGLVVD